VSQRAINQNIKSAYSETLDNFVDRQIGPGVLLCYAGRVACHSMISPRSICGRGGFILGDAHALIA